MSPTPTPEPMTPEQRAERVLQPKNDRHIPNAPGDGNDRAAYRQEIAVQISEAVTHATAAASARIAELERSVAQLTQERDSAEAGERATRAGLSYAMLIRAAFTNATPLTRAEREMRSWAVRYTRNALGAYWQPENVGPDELRSRTIDAIAAYDALLSARDGKAEEDAAVEAGLAELGFAGDTFMGASLRSLYRAGWRPAQEGKA